LSHKKREYIYTPDTKILRICKKTITKTEINEDFVSKINENVSNKPFKISNYFFK